MKKNFNIIIIIILLLQANVVWSANPSTNRVRLNVGEFCGNDVVDTGEQCDDGYNENGDGCSATCQNEYCGDSSVNNNGTEQCDDGNTNNGDGCSATCQTEYCGDGSVNNGGTEQCDDGGNNNGDGCSATCQTEYCGDALVNNNGEVCDSNTDSCISGGYLGEKLCNGTCNGWNACVPSFFCGDGTVNGPEACDDGNNIDCDGCRSDCTRQDSACGDGYLECSEICDAYLGVPTGKRCNDECLLEDDTFGIILPDFFTEVFIFNIAKETTQNSAIVRWNTNKSALCSFEWRESADVFTYTAYEIESKTAHDVQVVELYPDKTYFFTIECRDSWGHKTRTPVDSFLTKSLVDKNPPANVSKFKANPINGSMILSWENPKDSDFVAVKIRRSERFFPKNQLDGIEIYNDHGIQAVDKNVKAGVRYYYTAFAYDNNGNYSSGSLAAGYIIKTGVSPVIPKTGVTKPPVKPTQPGKEKPVEENKTGEPLTPPVIPKTEPEPQPTPEPEPVIPEPKEGTEVAQIPFKDIDCLVSLDSLKLEVASNTINLFASTEFKVRVSSSSLPLGIYSLTATIKSLENQENQESNYFLQYNKDSQQYAGSIIAPDAIGLYSLVVSFLGKDNDLIGESKGNINVQHMGQVSSVIDYKKNIKNPIQAAKLTLYQLEEGDMYKWDSSKYLQFNPVFTNSEGRYGFYVPNGKYLIKAEKDNFYNYSSLPLTVKNNLVNFDVEMIYVPEINIWMFLFYIIILIPLYFVTRRLFLIVFRNRKKHQLPGWVNRF